MSLIPDLVQELYDHKAVNILALDLQGISSTTDTFVIAEGTVDRHVKSLAKYALDLLRKHGYRGIRVDGMENGDWVAIDAGEVMIHLFTPELREKYALEQLWHKAKVVDVPIKIARK